MYGYNAISTSPECQEVTGMGPRPWVHVQTFVSGLKALHRFFFVNVKLVEPFGKKGGGGARCCLETDMGLLHCCSL